MSDVEKALEEIMERKVMLKTQLKATRRKQTMLNLWRCRREKWRAFAQHRKERGVMQLRMKRMLNQSQRSQGGVVEKQLHIYARKMIWLRNGITKA